MTMRRVDERYALQRPVGKGGSGVVWLGHDTVLERDVALKQIGMPPGSEDPDVVRAEREARLAAQINHPYVVAVFDVVATAGDHWLVMEYLDGGTLADRIRAHGPLAPADAAPILLQVAEALAAAHAAGVVHRDVKPSNVLLDSAGNAKLSDFGIARGAGDGSLTATGLVTGSPAFLAPEVASGASATAASDVWSFGALMFNLLAGRPPYDVGDNLMGALYKIVNEEPPRLRGAGWLGPLLEATMTKTVEARPAMTDVADYLRARLEDTPAPTTPASLLPDAPNTPVPPAPAAPPPAQTSMLPVAVAQNSAQVGERHRQGGRIAIGAVAILALVAILGAILLLGGNDDVPAAGLDTRTPGSSSAAPSANGSSASPPAVSRQELATFARNYVRTASTDPAAGFDLLTTDYQASSPRYRKFWNAVSDVRILRVRAVPDTLTVTYTYRYRLRGHGSRTETVVLHLVQDGDRLLIASAENGMPPEG